MRRMDVLAGALALVAGTVGASVAGCVISPGDSDCGAFPGEHCKGSGGGTSSTSTTSGTSSTTSTTSTGIPDVCMGDPLTDAKAIDDKCGIFVSKSGMANGKGTHDSPLGSISAGFVAAKTGKKPYLFVCDEAYTETATVKINAPIKIFGLMTGCEGGGTTWTVGTMHASLTGPAESVALVLESGATGEIDVNSLDVASPNSAMPGGSSVAVYVNGGTVNMTNGAITAGTGSNGDPGADAPQTPAASGSDGGNGGNACTADTQNGAPLISNTCGAVISSGGKGGDGNIGSGTPGAPGLPNNGAGQGGNGDDGSANWMNCAQSGGNGSDGTPGGNGNPGPGAPASSFGMLTSGGFTPVDGTKGDDGTPGQGGGGGGGVRGGAGDCAGMTGKGGASGGSGGSGGCGGQGGKGGKGGGSSIGLVSDSATVTLSMVTITVAMGGKGGDGGKAQSGGAASSGGKGGTNSGVSTLQAGCKGGGGGSGGSGGLGGGGRGGHSVGIASQGTAPTFDANSVTIGAAGTGGKGGLNDVKGNHGADGAAAKCWDFAKNLACN